MNASVAATGFEPDSGTAQHESQAPPCTQELSLISESLRRREQLLSASARASRLLLEAADAMGAVPDALRLIGEAAGVDRVTLMLAQTGPKGESLLVVASEWVAEGVTSQLGDPVLAVCDERSFPVVSAELRAGRSLCLSKSESTTECTAVPTEGVGTKTKAIVPIFVDGEFTGVVGFDNTRQRRAIEPTELSALETAAGVIGAVLHRERLVETVRREREHAAEQRMAELARANAALRGNLERLASEPDLGGFLGHLLLEAMRQLDAAGGAVIVADESRREWHIVAHAKSGELQPPGIADSVPLEGSVFAQIFGRRGEPLYIDIEHDDRELWPGALSAHRSLGYAGLIVFPLVFGDRNVGFVVLGFTRRDASEVQRSELLVALAQQATLAIALKGLAHSAKQSAVLGERNRIAREIHDGLAQAFTGILMQLGATEEMGACRRSSQLVAILARIRDLAREGLTEARRSVLALATDQTRRTGLPIALRQLATRATVPGSVTCQFEGSDIATGLRPEQEHELLRIAQEAVGNAVRHGQPRNVRISMTEDTTHWALVVTDDGRGMQQPPEFNERQGFGLTSMRERAGALGGDWQIETRPGTGTRVSVRLPKPQAA